MALMSLFIIPASSDDLHSLDIRRIGESIYITTNNRKMYEKWGTLVFSPSMAQQLIDGLSAVLSGTERAATQCQLDREANEAKLAAAARERNIAASVSNAAAYDDLFGES